MEKKKYRFVPEENASAGTKPPTGNMNSAIRKKVIVTKVLVLLSNRISRYLIIFDIF